jgi:hypothetical protein
LKARAPRWEARAATVSNSDSHRGTPTPQRRQAFSFSRDLEFATEPELAKRMGCPRPIWLRAALKELIDNSLDAAKEAGIESAIRVALDENILSVSDNGPGMSPELVERLCIRSERTSTREAYAAPDRGVQGNAVQVIVALPLGLGRDEAVTAITSRGVEHRIILKVNRLQQQLEVERTERAVPETPGAKVGLSLAVPDRRQQDRGAGRPARGAQSARPIPVAPAGVRRAFGRADAGREVDARTADAGALVRPRAVRASRAARDQP